MKYCPFNAPRKGNKLYSERAYLNNFKYEMLYRIFHTRISGGVFVDDTVINIISSLRAMEVEYCIAVRNIRNNIFVN